MRLILDVLNIIVIKDLAVLLMPLFGKRRRRPGEPLPPEVGQNMGAIGRGGGTATRRF
jgi:hypothetical protein